MVFPGRALRDPLFQYRYLFRIEPLWVFRGRHNIDLVVRGNPINQLAFLG